MAKENHISREEQDQIAYDSHRHAAAATEEGRLAAEICPVLVPSEVRARGDAGQPHPPRHVAGGAGRAAALSSIASTAR
jgi:acetyl-CoA acetyltransferase